MRAALVSAHASPVLPCASQEADGQSVHVASLAGALADLGTDVCVYTRRSDPALPDEVRLRDRVTVRHLDAGPPGRLRKDLLAAHVDELVLALGEAWRRDPPDVVHAHFWLSGKAALAACWPLGIPLVQSFHGLGVVKSRHQGPRDTSPAERIAVEQTIVRRADHVVASGSDELFELLRLGAEAARLSLVPSGVDTDVFRPEGPAEPRTPGCRRIVAISRLVERKGVACVIEALSDLPGAELVVAGGPHPSDLASDPDAGELRALADAMGVGDRVHLRGHVPHAQVPALIRSADVVVCTPHYETFGIVPLEAMACGVPVVATAVGGLVDTVVDGVTGLLVPPHRPDRLAAALQELLEDDARRRSLGGAGRARVCGRYTWRRTASTLLGLYRDLQAGARRATRAGTF